MVFQKPTVIVSGPALTAIQGSKQVDNPVDNLVMPNIFESTAGAYEADE